MWYGFYEGKPAFETFTKSQKILNLRRDDRISVLVEDGDAYEKLRGVEIVGRGEVIDDKTSCARSPARSCSATWACPRPTRMPRRRC